MEVSLSLAVTVRVLPVPPPCGGNDVVHARIDRLPAEVGLDLAARSHQGRGITGTPGLDAGRNSEDSAIGRVSGSSNRLAVELRMNFRTPASVIASSRLRPLETFSCRYLNGLCIDSPTSE